MREVNLLAKLVRPYGASRTADSTTSSSAEVLFREAGLMMSSTFDFQKLALEEV